MTNIGICDDEESTRREIREICGELAGDLGFQAEFVLFEDGNEVLSSSVQLDVLILDIEMPGINGIETKQRLEGIQEQIRIIYVTGHEERMRQAFGTGVFGFVDKKYLREQLCQVMTNAIRAVLKKTVYVDGRIDSRKILYIQSEHVYGKVIVNDGTQHLIRVSMKELGQELAEVDFVRTHRCFLVNLRWVDRICGDRIYLSKREIPISRNHLKTVKEAFKKFCWENGRYC